MSGPARRGRPARASSAATTAASVAAVRKLAHTLGVPSERLDYLAGLPADDVRRLRAQVAEALFEADRPRFARMAALSSAVPVALAAKVTQHALPPLLAARAAELVDPARAAELVSRLPDSYLADVSAAMDASRAPDVVARIPADRLATVAVELARRAEWVVIGGFVAEVSREALAAAVARLTGGQLLRIAIVLDDKDRLDEIGDLLTDAQLDDMLASGATDELWLELDDLVGHLTGPRVDRLAARLAAAPPAVVAAVRAAVADGRLSVAGRLLEAA